MHRTLFIFLAALVVALSLPAQAQQGGKLGPIMGVTAVERTDSVQADGSRTIVIYLFFYNDARKPVQIRQGNLSLVDDERQICPKWRNGGPATFKVPPGQVKFISPSFTYKGARDLAMTLNYQNDQGQNWSVPVSVRNTNLGNFNILPQTIQDQVMTALKNDPAMKWWSP